MGDTIGSNKYAWRADLAPAIIVLLISVPLSLGIAIAAGVPPVRGLVTGIVGGLVIGRLAGSPVQISGPSAGLAVMVLDAVTDHGLGALGAIVAIVGVLQLLAGFFRLGQVFRAVSPAVINAMLAGIGVLILSAQAHVMVDDAPRASGLENLLAIPVSVYKALFPAEHGTPHHWAALTGLLTLAVVLGLRAFKRGPLSKVPAPLAAVGIATLAVWIFDIPVRKVDMPERILEAFALPTTETLGLLASPAIWVTGITLAIVASAETLLCATAVDAMQEGERTNYDKELLAQGFGNSICALLGAPPASGVITRSTANVEAGATTRASAMMMGAFMLTILVAFPRVLEVVPRASLAALLVYVGFKLVKGRPYAELKRYGSSELLIFIITLTAIVALNLLTGIIIGSLLAATKLVISQREKFARFTVHQERDHGTNQIHVHLRGAASFLRIPRMAAVLESLPEHAEVHLHVEELDYIDHACLDLLDRWECERLRKRAPVRVQWQTLHHRYHSGNTLDRTPIQHLEPPSDSLKLLDFLTPRRIVIAPTFESKWHAIEFLSRFLAETDAGIDFTSLLQSVRSREHEASTCIGHGLMIPHGTIAEGRPMTGVMAVSAAGWSFGAPEGDRIHCVLLLATPPSRASRHLAVLAAFARLFMTNADLKERLIAAQTPGQVYTLLQDEEASGVNYSFEPRPETN